MKSSAAVILASAATALSLPSSSLQKRAEICGQYESVESGPYIVYNNLWNMDAAEGEQCTGVDSDNGTALAWHTNWSWTGSDSQVISYANAVLDVDAQQISSISSIPSTWSWSYEGNEMVANVAYDLFTSSTPDGDEEYEVMIWLAALGGAGPISETGEPIAEVDIAGTTWSLWDGQNGNMHVFSFVVNGDNQVADFDGDLKEFLTYLTTEQGMEESQYVINIGAGTEPFSGTDAVFTTSGYDVQVS